MPPKASQRRARPSPDARACYIKLFFWGVGRGRAGGGHAGGGWAAGCWRAVDDPVAVEESRAAAGSDIGGTLIGMHLKRVAVPVRLTLDHIGQAHILCARTRPKLIGGERARYTEED